MNPSLGQHGNFATQHNKQSGTALIIFFLVLILAGMAVLFSTLDSNGIKIERDKKTAAALAEAKAALLGWSAGHATMPGALPCPDTNNTGSKGACTVFAGIIGRLPWKTLGIIDLRDGNGECLWYALSPIYRDTIAVASRGPSPINSNIPGTIMVMGADGITLSVPVNPVIAVIIAPGAPLTGQDRSSAVSTVCGGNTTASNYLDSALGVNNSTGNVAGSNYTFIAGAASNTFNDRLIYITAAEFYQAVRKRIVKEILGNLDVPSGPVNYFNDVTKGNGTYPCPAATPTGNMDCTPPLPIVGNVPYNDPNPAVSLQYATLGSWLTENGWFGLATYSYTNATHVKVTLADVLGSYSCDANANVFTCASP